MINASSPSWSLDNNQWALVTSQFASPPAPAEIWGAIRGGGSPRPGGVPAEGFPQLPKAWSVARQLAARGGNYSFQSALRRWAEPGSARSQLGGLWALPKSCRWSRAGGRARGRVPGTRPGAGGLGGGAARAGQASGGSPGTGPSGGGDHSRLRGSGCSRGAEPWAHLTRVRLRGRAGLGRTPSAAASLQPFLFAAAGATARARAGATSPPGSRAPSHGFRQFPPHLALVYLRKEKVPRIRARPPGLGSQRGVGDRGRVGRRCLRQSLQGEGAGVWVVRGSRSGSGRKGRWPWLVSLTARESAEGLLGPELRFLSW